MTTADVTQLRDQLDMLAATIADTIDLLESGRHPLAGVGVEHHTQWLRTNLGAATNNLRSLLIYCHQMEIQS